MDYIDINQRPMMVTSVDKGRKSKRGLGQDFAREDPKFGNENSNKFYMWTNTPAPLFVQFTLLMTTKLFQRKL